MLTIFYAPEVFYMNDSEMRRRELLRQTRRLYDDKREIPAVHPRYGRIYHNLYEDNSGEQEASGGTFYIRLVIGILCFVCFVYMDQSKAEIAQVNSTAIVNQIEKGMGHRCDRGGVESFNKKFFLLVQESDRKQRRNPVK